MKHEETILAKLSEYLDLPSIVATVHTVIRDKYVKILDNSSEESLKSDFSFQSRQKSPRKYS